MKKSYFVSLAAVFMLALFSFSIVEGAMNDEATTLTAYQTSDSVTLDGDASESAWNNADSLSFSDVDGSGVDVTLKAIHDGTNIYAYATWTDDTMHNTRKGWSFNGTGWENVGGSEDRFNIAWAAGTTGIACGHNPDTSDGMLFDVWHWKATRTAPANWADDKFWDGTGRHGDDQTAGGYSENSVVKQAGNASAITTVLGNTSAVSAFSNDDRPYWDASGNVITWSDGANTSVLTDTISGYKTVKPTGSHGDVSTGSKHDGSAWHVEYKRALDTGNSDDDVAFSVGSSVTFYVSLHNNSGDDAHFKVGGSTPKAYTLTLSSETGPAGGLISGFEFIAVLIGLIAVVPVLRNRKK